MAAVLLSGPGAVLSHRSACPVGRCAVRLKGGIVGRAISRREAVAGAAMGAVSFGGMAGAAPAAAAPAADGVRGSWRITPKLPPGAPPFVALAAFGAGGIFITTGSDEPGTGIGQWKSTSTRGFSFAYTNFHFDSSGHLNNTVDVKAKGTFHGSKMTGTAELHRVDASGNPVGSPLTTKFTGKRMSA
jgi:hypothetical protein